MSKVVHLDSRGDAMLSESDESILASTLCHLMLEGWQLNRDSVRELMKWFVPQTNSCNSNLLSMVMVGKPSWTDWLAGFERRWSPMQGRISHVNGRPSPEFLKVAKRIMLYALKVRQDQTSHRRREQETHESTPDKTNPNSTLTATRSNSTLAEPRPSSTPIFTQSSSTPVSTRPNSTPVSTKSSSASIRTLSESTPTGVRTKFTPTEAWSKSNSTETRPKSTSTDARHRLTPVETRPKSTSTEARHKSTPTETRPKSTSTEARHKSTPTETRPKSTSTEVRHKSTPTETRPNSTPTEKRPKSTPTETRPKSTPTETRSKSSSTETRPKSTPTETQPKSTPADTRSKSTLTEAWSKSTSTDARHKSSPTETRPKSTSTETRPKSSSTETRPKSTPTETRPKSTSTEKISRGAGCSSSIQNGHVHHGRGVKAVEQYPDQGFQVERILAIKLRPCRSGKSKERLYLVKWKNYSFDDNSWEPRCNLDCVESMRDFESFWQELTMRQRSSLINAANFDCLSYQTVFNNLIASENCEFLDIPPMTSATPAYDAQGQSVERAENSHEESVTPAYESREESGAPAHESREESSALAKDTPEESGVRADDTKEESASGTPAMDSPMTAPGAGNVSIACHDTSTNDKVVPPDGNATNHNPKSTAIHESDPLGEHSGDGEKKSKTVMQQVTPPLTLSTRSMSRRASVTPKSQKSKSDENVHSRSSSRKTEHRHRRTSAIRSPPVLATKQPSAVATSPSTILTRSVRSGRERSSASVRARRSVAGVVADRPRNSRRASLDPAVSRLRGDRESSVVSKAESTASGDRTAAPLLVEPSSDPTDHPATTTPLPSPLPATETPLRASTIEPTAVGSGGKSEHPVSTIDRTSIDSTPAGLTLELAAERRRPTPSEFTGFPAGVLAWHQHRPLCHLQPCCSRQRCHEYRPLRASNAALQRHLLAATQLEVCDFWRRRLAAASARRQDDTLQCWASPTRGSRVQLASVVPFHPPTTNPTTTADPIREHESVVSAMPSPSSTPVVQCQTPGERNHSEMELCGLPLDPPARTPADNAACVAVATASSVSIPPPVSSSVQSRGSTRPRKRRRGAGDCFSILRKRQKKRKISRVNHSDTGTYTDTSQSGSVSESADQSKRLSESVNQSERLSENGNQSMPLSENANQSERSSESAGQSARLSESADQSERSSESAGQSERSSESADQSGRLPDVSELKREQQSMEVDARDESVDASTTVDDAASSDFDDDDDDDDDDDENSTPSNAKQVITVFPPIVQSFEGTQKWRSLDLETVSGVVHITVVPKVRDKDNTLRPLSKTTRKKIGFSEFHDWLECVALRDVIKYVMPWPRPNRYDDDEDTSAASLTPRGPGRPRKHRPPTSTTGPGAATNTVQPPCSNSNAALTSLSTPTAATSSYTPTTSCHSASSQIAIPSLKPSTTPVSTDRHLNEKDKRTTKTSEGSAAGSVVSNTTDQCTDGAVSRVSEKCQPSLTSKVSEVSKMSNGDMRLSDIRVKTASTAPAMKWVSKDLQLSESDDDTSDAN